MTMSCATLEESITRLVHEAQSVLNYPRSDFPDLIANSVLAFEHLKSTQNLIKSWRVERLKAESVKHEE